MMTVDTGKSRNLPFQKNERMSRTKTCTRCHEEKLLNKQTFYPHPAFRDGFRTECIACHSRRGRENYAANRARRREAHKTWYNNNKERKRAQDKQWQLLNPLVAVAGKKIAFANRRAVYVGDANVLTTDDVLNQYYSQDGKCYYCSIDIGTVFSLDHILPVCRGGLNTPSNICCSCKPCNLEKGRHTMVDFITEKGNT